MNRTRIPILSALLLLALPVLAGSGFDHATYEAFVDMRVGDGSHPVYWYSVGELYSYPDGKVVAIVEGIDTARLLPVEGDCDTNHQLSRKIFVYRDPASGEVLEEVNGQPVRPIAYPYQYITYRHEGDELVTFVEQGSGERLRKIGPGRSSVARSFGEITAITSPLFLDFPTPRGRYQAFENYDFFLQPAGNPERQQLSWVRYGDLPPWAGPGKAIMHLIARRVDRFEDLPETMRSYVEKKAPLWMGPPVDLNEIRELQESDVTGAQPFTKGAEKTE